MHDTTRLSGEPPDEPKAEPVPAAPPPPARAEGAEEELIVVGAGLDLSDPNSPLAPLYLRTSHVVLAGLLAAFFAAFTHFPVHHTDVWAHLRFGQEIVRHRALPRHEPFSESFADKEAPYVHYQWLAQAGAYLVYQAGAALSPPDADHRLGGGALLLLTAHALILVLRFVLLYVAFCRLTDSPLVALHGVALAASMGLVVHLMILRPQILGELTFAAVLLALSRPVLSRRALVWVPLVFLVWANCHGSFAMGFALLGAVTAGRALEVVGSAGGGTLDAYLSAVRAPRASLRALLADVQLRRLSALLALCVLATMVNPHGPVLLYDSYALSKNANIPTMEEWKPLPFRNAVHVVFFGSVLLLALLLRLSPRRFTPAQVLLLLGFGLESVAHARMVVWWVMVFTWVAVPHLRAIAGRFPWIDDRSVPSLRKTVAAVVIIVSLLAWSRTAIWLVWGDAPTSAGRVTAVTPVHVLDLIRTVDATRDLAARLSAGTPLEAAAVSPTGPRPHVIFASETLGDYLLWDLGQRGREPAVRLCCYTHVHLFTAEHWARCMQVKNANRGWQQLLDEWGADVMVLEYDLYEQDEHRKQGKHPGFSDLIDRVREASDRWQVISGPGEPVFVAQRIR
jgi:hypothetical protein